MTSYPVYNLHYERIMKFVMTTVLVTICVSGLIGKIYDFNQNFR